MLFEYTVIRAWRDLLMQTDPPLSKYDAAEQAEIEQRFCQVDTELVELARREVQARLAKEVPHLPLNTNVAASPGSEASLLIKQLNRRARFAPPRVLFQKCPGLMRTLKPCVLMSPQSVAQYLDPALEPFDLVIFDEASQIPVHEAIGAVCRGRQLVVVGDTKQLPPTSFFLAGSPDENDSSELLTVAESILEECEAILPVRRLEWHYRSRHPSLISFSNSRYYENRLQVLPSPARQVAGLGLSRVLVPNAVYDRGGTATNSVEAVALVDDLCRRLRDPAQRDRTVGVVTFSRRQQTLIQDMLLERVEADPSLEPFFEEGPGREHVFVKNLENVQGDERDVVLFSIGYGPDQKGRMTANLGPLGQQGGERRLNVVITRAREALVVFVSFESSQLDASNTSARGIHDLKAFLDSAATGGQSLVRLDDSHSDPAGDLLRSDIAEKLAERGVHADLEVGVGRYRMDLAIPDEHGNYVLGIELNGNRFFETPTARGRLRQRWAVLRGLGWTRLYRVRAMQWYNQPERVIDEILSLL